MPGLFALIYGIIEAGQGAWTDTHVLIAFGEALAAVVGPLIEVLVLIGLVYVALWMGRRFYKGGASVPRTEAVVSAPGD